MSRTSRLSEEVTSPSTRPRAPFATLRINAVTAGLFAFAAVASGLAGGTMLGGRWLPVHLFTLGVVTNVIPAFTGHFSTTLTRQPGRQRWWQFALLNVGIVCLLGGMVLGITPAVGIGATMITAAVVHNWLQIRRHRRGGVGARFAWVVRMYERSHGAFIHGALLGGLMGTGVLGGAWYASARLAHLHVNVLGWAGLTLLSTLVFFGPTVLRVRIEQGADARARRWLSYGATALTVAVVALLASGIGGVAGTALRVGAAAGLGVYAVASVFVCLPVLRVARKAQPSFSGGLLRAACCWLPAAAVADTLIVATGSWRLLDAVGIAFLVGAVGQAIVGALGYVAPMFTGADPADRARIRTVLERGAVLRPLAGNAGLVVVVAAAVVGPSGGAVGSATMRAGWLLLVVILLGQLAAALLRRPSGERGAAAGN